jgi:hypothetical protein
MDVMGIIDQVSAFVNRDGARAGAIADEWGAQPAFQAKWLKDEIPNGIEQGSGVGGLIARDPRLMRQWEVNPDGVAAAAMRVDNVHTQAATLGNEPRPFANRMLYDLAVQKIAQETLKEDRRIRMPVNIYDLVGVKSAEKVALAIHDLDRPSREKLAAGVTEGLPRDFLEKVVAPLPRLERTHSESDRRRESAGRGTSPQPMGKTDERPNPYDNLIAPRGASNGR